MSTAVQKSSCREYVGLLGSYLDGELDAPWMIEIESHVASCGTCREQTELLKSTKASLKRMVRRPATPEAMAALRSRVQVAMLAEAARAEVRDANDTKSARMFTWRSVVPLATAAAIALAYGATRTNTTARTNAETAGFGDDLLQELIAEHAQPLPPEATDAKGVRGLEQYIGVPVRPASFERAGAKLVGGRIVPVRGSTRAAMLQYVVMNGDEPRRVSVIVFDPSKIQVSTADFAPRAIGTAHVQVGQAKGYSVAVTQRAGVGYAVATDMDPDHSAQFAAHAVYDE